MVLFFFIYSSFFLGIHRNWNYSRFSCIYRCLLLITTAEKVTWELNCSKSCNLYSCSPRLHCWSWKWERWYVEFVRKSKKSITSFVLYNLLLFNFWGQFQRLGVTLGQKSEILIEAMCDSLHRGKRCLGKAGADTCGSQDNLTAPSLGESLPRNTHSSWKEEPCLAPFGGTVATRAPAPQNGINYSELGTIPT